MLKNEVAVVTGAASGIGRAVAQRFAEEEARLLLLDKDAGKLEEVVLQLREQGTVADAFPADVLKYEQMQEAADHAVALYGRIDIWCNCAGVSTMNHVWEISEQEWDFNMNVNAKGVFLCVKAAANKMMPQRYGRIINIASIASLQCDPLLAHYCASKWAVLGFSKTAAYELAKFGITVNCVCPGTVSTDMQIREMRWSAELQGITPEQVYQNWVDGTPIGRLTTPADIADAVTFLARRQSGMMTGIALPVTGGAEI